MSTLTPCPACSRHVRPDASACPFCAARLAPRTLGRGLAAAAGAGLVLATVGCPDGNKAIPEGQPAQGQTTRKAAGEDAEAAGAGEAEATDADAMQDGGADAADPRERAVAPPYGAVPPPPPPADSSEDSPPAKEPEAEPEAPR